MAIDTRQSGGLFIENPFSPTARIKKLESDVKTLSEIVALLLNEHSDAPNYKKVLAELNNVNPAIDDSFIFLKKYGCEI